MIWILWAVPSISSRTCKTHYLRGYGYRFYFKTVNKLNKVNKKVDLLPTVLANPFETSMEGLAIVNAVQTHHLKPSPLRARHYAVRAYCQFVSEFQDKLFARYPSDYFPVKKGTFLLFLGWVWEPRLSIQTIYRQYYTVLNRINCADGVNRQWETFWHQNHRFLMFCHSVPVSKSVYKHCNFLYIVFSYHLSHFILFFCDWKV